MLRIHSVCLDAFIAALILIPVTYILNRFFWKNTEKAVGFIIFSVYLAGVFSVAGLPDIRYIRFCPHFNFQPFAYMFSDFTNSFLNVVMFLPMGLLLPLLWNHFRALPRTLIFGFCVSLLIEFLQIFTYRASDVNDLITNTAGTLTGWLAAKGILFLMPQLKSSDNQREVYIISLIAVSVMIFLHPFLSEWILYR